MRDLFRQKGGIFSLLILISKQARHRVFERWNCRQLKWGREEEGCLIDGRIIPKLEVWWKAPDFWPSKFLSRLPFWLRWGSDIC